MHTWLTSILLYYLDFDHTSKCTVKDQDMENVFLCYKVDSRNCIENKKFQLIQLHLYITTA